MKLKDMKGISKMDKNLREIQEEIVKMRVQNMDGALATYIKHSIQLLEYQGKDITQYTLVQVSNPMETIESGLRVIMQWRIMLISELRNVPTYSEGEDA